jgi:hypothetical protein
MCFFDCSLGANKVNLLTVLEEEKMKNLVMLFCTIMVVLAGTARAETIFETFGSDPLTNGWSKTEAGGTAFNYVSGGYMNVTMDYKDTTYQSRFTKSTASYTKTQEFWMEMDIKHGTNSSWTQNGYYAVMKSGDTSNEKNLIGDRLFFAYSASANPVGSDRGNRHDVYAYASDATSGVMNKTNPIPYPHLDSGNECYRSKLHYFYDSVAGVGKAEMSIYAINLDGSTGAFQYSSSVLDNGVTIGTVVAAGKTLDFDVFGLANRTDNPLYRPAQNMLIDNLYFSTECANLAPVAPAFIPEPATLALLGLGALVLRRKK